MPSRRSTLRWFHPAVLAVSATLLTTSARADDWPQWLGPRRDGVWRESGLVERFPEGGPKVLWRQPIGTGYSGPAVVGDRVYVMDRQRAKGPDGKPARPTRAGIPGNERVLCLDAVTGKEVWRHAYDCPYKMSYPSGPRTTPLVRDGRVYTLGAMGDLLCLDAGTGKVRWSKKLLEAYQAPLPVWGFAAHPLLEGDLLYCLVGGPGSAVVAFHKDTGKEVWKALAAEEVGYSPPVLAEAAGRRHLLIWHSEAINALDPASGKVLWTVKYPPRSEPMRPAVSIATPEVAGDLVFLSTVYHGPMMLRLAKDRPDAEVLWRSRSDDPREVDGLRVLMAPPVIQDGRVYGVCAMGELRCLKADTGEQVWETLAATGGKAADCASAFLVPQGDRFVIFNDQGDLILADLSPKGYKEIDRCHLLEPDHDSRRRGRMVVWSHPAFARKCVFARNDHEIVCVSLARDA